MKAIILYVDFRKAFDSIHRGMIMKILKAYDIPTRLLAVIKTMSRKQEQELLHLMDKQNTLKLRQEFSKGIL